MANTLNGMIFSNIARIGLKYMQKKLVPIQAFSTNLSPEAAVIGTTVSTRLLGAPAAAQDVVSTLSGDYSAGVTDMTTTAVTVTLGNPMVTGWSFTEQEMNKIEAGVINDSTEKLIASHAQALAGTVLTSAFNLVTNANYSTAALTKASASIDADDFGTLRSIAVKAGFDMDMTSAIINADIYAALSNSNDITDKTNVLIDGNVPKVRGFSIYEAPTLADSNAASGEYLTGFIATPDAIAIAIRPTKAIAGGEFVWDETVVDEKSGLPLRYTVTYNRAKRRLEHMFEIVYGVAKGNPAALKRIVSQ